MFYPSYRRRRSRRPYRPSIVALCATGEARRMRTNEPILTSVLRLPHPIAQSFRVRRRALIRNVDMSLRHRTPGRQHPRSVTSLNFHDSLTTQGLIS